VCLIVPIKKIGDVSDDDDAAGRQPGDDSQANEAEQA
jgi:hypothetical protein